MRAPKADADKRDRFGAEPLHMIEALASALEQDADQIDDHGGVTHRAFDRARIAHIGLHRMNLADAAERLQMAGKFRPPHGDADAVAPFGERTHDMAAEKAGAAENGDQRVGVGLASHDEVANLPSCGGRTIYLSPL